MKNRTFLSAILISFLCCSCKDNDPDFNRIQPSVSFIEMEGEGGEVDISFTNPDWEIAGIRNQNGDVFIFGDTYDGDGNLIRKNSNLKLEGQGRLNAIWGDKGFRITRNTATSLNIVVLENSTGEGFNFDLVLESGDESTVIEVNQKKSQGYTFKKIAYHLGTHDGDSIFVRQGIRYTFTVLADREFTFNPVQGINVVKTSLFESNENDAFVWTSANPLSVEVPSDIWDNNIYFAGDECIYTNTSFVSPSDYSNLTETVTIGTGTSTLSIEVQYRKRMVSYVLYLENNRTKAEKLINGKWIEFAPTGQYSINWEGK